MGPFPKLKELDRLLPWSDNLPEGFRTKNQGTSDYLLTKKCYYNKTFESQPFKSFIINTVFLP
ncbi:hypothetical protein DWZ56_19665 [Lachnotalea sp. AF33-28]|nr:hypothetical protein DWZ56_19665 [Lachnotalea sp. AF33-28]